MDGFALFPTPVFVLDVPGLDALAGGLVPRVIAESARDPGISVSNGGGTWHSAPDLARRGDPAWDAVARLILGGVRQVFDTVARSSGVDTTTRELRYAVQMWATVTPPGGYAVVHEHSESHWSTALYLDPGDSLPDSQSGVLAFVDPRRVPAVIAGVDLFPSTFSVRPRAGALVVFPGWLQHFVHPYRGTRPRICVSANVRIEAV